MSDLYAKDAITLTLSVNPDYVAACEYIEQMPDPRIGHTRKMINIYDKEATKAFQEYHDKLFLYLYHLSIKVAVEKRLSDIAGSSATWFEDTLNDIRCIGRSSASLWSMAYLPLFYKPADDIKPSFCHKVRDVGKCFREKLRTLSPLRL